MQVEKLRPFIGAEYRTLRGPRYTGIGGSSPGGLGSPYRQNRGRLAVSLVERPRHWAIADLADTGGSDSAVPGPPKCAGPARGVDCQSWRPGHFAARAGIERQATTAGKMRDRRKMRGTCAAGGMYDDGAWARRVKQIAVSTRPDNPGYFLRRRPPTTRMGGENGGRHSRENAEHRHREEGLFDECRGTEKCAC